MVWWVADLKVPTFVSETFPKPLLALLGLNENGIFHWLIPSKDEANNFKSTIQWATLFLVLAPFVVFGTWVAAFAYEERRSPTQVGALIRLIYNFVFASFRGLGVQLPSFSFNISSISKAYNQFANMEFEFTLYTPNDYLAVSSALTALNFAISIVKIVLNGVGFVMAWSEQSMEYCSVNFCDISLATTDSAAAVAIKKVIEKREREATSLKKVQILEEKERDRLKAEDDALKAKEEAKEAAETAE